MSSHQQVGSAEQDLVPLQMMSLARLLEEREARFR
jgi:hypothetical protein